MHYLKIWPEFFEKMSTLTKTFEVRKNDRDYRIGDMLVLKEYLPVEDIYTGRTLNRVIVYMTDFGCADGYIIAGVEPIKKKRNGWEI